ncbi:MAG: TIGR03792 family protein, partial [Cyanobacteriota bacterium]|nr:TIGR03792 family protein [Cyanobacteriota bacterium]
RNLADIRRGATLHLLTVVTPGQSLEAGAGQGRKPVVEHLRLRVPAEGRNAWLEAEQQIWDPWLRRQKGYLGREVLWHGDRQEGVLLIFWSNRDDWKAITASEVATVQRRFEELAKASLALPSESDSPFPLVHAAEVVPP